MRARACSRCPFPPLRTHTDVRAGWLINIENEVDWEGGTELVVAFLELLTRRMHQAVPAADPEAASPALVLWYDSVTHDTGELKWQDGTWGVQAYS